jgi:hypothetical protein
MISFTLTALILAAESVQAAPPTPNEHVVGAVVAPAALPGGSTSIYGLVGAPDIGVGYRQGISAFEFEAKAQFNLFELSGVIEAGAKLAVYKTSRLIIAPGLALGLKLDSGSRYFDRWNFAYIGVRPRLSLSASYGLSDLIQGLAMIELPWSFGLSAASSQTTPTAGVGAEFHLGSRLSLLATGHLGVDVIKEPLGVAHVRPAWAIRIGIGYRVF